MTIEELIELVHLLLMCGINDKSALESGNLTNEEWLRMKGLIDKYQSEKPGPEADPKPSDLISRSELKKEIQNLYDETPDGIVRFGIEKSYDVIDNAPTVAPKFKPVCEVAFDKEELKRLVDENLDKIHNDCENCKHQAKLPSQDPCHRCLYCYTSQFEQKDGSEPDMMTEDKLCDECEEKCDWYKESIEKGNMPIGCTQQIAPENEDEEEEYGES